MTSMSKLSDSDFLITELTSNEKDLRMSIKLISMRQMTMMREKRSEFATLTFIIFELNI